MDKKHKKLLDAFISAFPDDVLETPHAYIITIFKDSEKSEEQKDSEAVCSYCEYLDWSTEYTSYPPMFRCKKYGVLVHAGDVCLGDEEGYRRRDSMTCNTISSRPIKNYKVTLKAGDTYTCNSKEKK